VRLRVDGGELEYAVAGDGPALLLLHAFPLALFMWDAQAAALAATHRVIRLAALLEHLGIPKAVVGGCSMGGYAALAFVRRHPQRLLGLVLQDTRAGADSEEGKSGRTALAAKVLAEGASVAVSAFLPKLLGETSHREQQPLVAALRERILGTSPQAIAAALHGLAARADSGPTLSQVRVPTLVLVGAEDVLTPPAESQAMAAAIPGARLEIVPRAGHLANLERPEAVNAAFASFLAG
jgi:pimeloyl-ACP methyl ester carboxylesterase